MHLIEIYLILIRPKKVKGYAMNQLSRELSKGSDPSFEGTKSQDPVVDGKWCPLRFQ